MYKPTMCLINDKGELLEILQSEYVVSEEDKDKKFIVPLKGYYEVFNVCGFNYAKYSFKTKSWQGFYDPEWNAKKKEWVEVADLAEIEKKKKAELLKPSQEELDKAKRDLEIINLLTELGVV